MATTQTQARFLQGSLAKHIIITTLAGSLGLMFLFVVDLVDMYFIGLLGEPSLAAAIGYASTILFFTTSICIGLAIASGVLVGRELGAGRTQRARELATNAAFTSVLLTCPIAAFTWWYAPEMIQVLGADGETAKLATNYLRIIVPSMPILSVAINSGAVLRAHGAAVKATMATLTGGSVNAVLDPIFIFALSMNLDGAALASVVARIAMLIASLVPAIRQYDAFAPIRLRIGVSEFKTIFAIALPAILTNLATPVGNAWVIRAIADFGESAVAGMAVVGRLTPVAFAMVFALSGAIGPVFAQNAGANQLGRVRSALNNALLLSLVYVIVVAVILYLLRGPILLAFPVTGIGRELVLLFCGPLALAWIFNGWLFVSNASFNNLNHPFYSTSFNWSKNTLGTIPFVWLGGIWGGAPGVMIGQAVGGIVIALVAMIIAYRLISAGDDLCDQQPGLLRRLRQWSYPPNPQSTQR
jgi:putative MATE family efflux protein